MKTGNDIRIIIADDHEFFRDGFKLMLSRQKDIILVGEAENGRELVKLVHEHKPDVVVTDIKMPVLDGIEATRQIAAAYPGIGIISLSMFDEDDLIIDMLEAGATGYLIKNADKEQIIDAIHTVYNGDPFYCRSTGSKLVKLISSSKFNPYKKKEVISFTEREHEIIHLISEELTNKQIADRLFVSVRTVEGNRAAIMTKMNVTNTVGILIYAIKNKLVKI